jgi:hypothetical protein
VRRRCFLGRAMRTLGLFSVLTMAAVAFGTVEVHLKNELRPAHLLPQK